MKYRNLILAATAVLIGATPLAQAAERRVDISVDLGYYLPAHLRYVRDSAPVAIYPPLPVPHVYYRPVHAQPYYYAPPHYYRHDHRWHKRAWRHHNRHHHRADHHYVQHDSYRDGRRDDRGGRGDHGDRGGRGDRR